MKKSAVLFIPLIVFILLAVFFVWSLEWRKVESSQMVNRAMVGKIFPHFNLNSIDQATSYSNKDLPKNRPYLINVWASWCPTCYVEHDYLQELSDRGVIIIGINYKDERLAAQKYLNDLGNPYHLNLADIRGSLAIDLGVTGAPETYLVAASGEIVYKHQGVVDDKLWVNSLEPLYSQLNNQFDNQLSNSN